MEEKSIESNDTFQIASETDLSPDSLKIRSKSEYPLNNRDSTERSSVLRYWLHMNYHSSHSLSRLYYVYMLTNSFVLCRRTVSAEPNSDRDTNSLLRTSSAALFDKIKIFEQPKAKPIFPSNFHALTPTEYSRKEGSASVGFFRSTMQVSIPSPYPSPIAL
jgi:hypothetical protein